MYHAAEHSADFSTNGGKNWSSYQMTTTQRLTNATGSRVPMDYQRIVADFAGGVAFVSDQGLFIQPADDSVELIGACGNMSNNIAIAVAVSKVRVRVRVKVRVRVRVRVLGSGLG